MLEPGQHVAHYVIEKPLGSGGMGEVFLAFDERLERRVALKLLPSALAGDIDARERMLREARAASALDHPGIVTVFDVGEHAGRTFIGMEIVEGDTFADLLRRRGHLPAVEAVALVRQAGEAIEAAHAAGILHRDIKTANLMLDRKGRVKVLDFGLSKRVGATPSRPPRMATPVPMLDIDPDAPTEAPSGSTPRPAGSGDPLTVAGARMGTPGYSALELLRGEDADARSDVFSLAVVLHELVTGSRPYAGATWAELETALTEERMAPRAAAMPPRLDAVLRRALRAARDGRPATVAAFTSAATAAVASPAWIPWTIGGVVVVGAAVAFVAWPGDRHAAPAPAAAPADAGAPAALFDPSARRVLTHGGGCAFAPAFVDDRTLTFDRTLGDAVDVYRVSIDGGTPEQLTSAPPWEWRSVPGRRPGEILHMIYDPSGATKTSIAAVDLATHRSEVLLEVESPTAVAHGDTIYYANSSLTEIRRMRGARDDVLLEVGHDEATQELSISSDGSLLGFTSYGDDVETRQCVVEAASGEHRCLARRYMMPGRTWFSHDGHHLYFAAQDGIRRMTEDAKEDELVVPGVRGFGGITISPDGTTMVWSTCTDRSTLRDGTGAQIIEGEYVSDPSAGPGGVLVYVDKGGLMLRDAGGAVRQVTNRMVGDVRSPSVSPDGQQIAFVSNEAKPALYVITLGGGSPVRLTDASADSQPIWIDDDRIAFVRRDEKDVGHLHGVSIASGTVEQLLPRPAELVGRDAEGALIVHDAGDRKWLRWKPGTKRPTAAALPVPADATDAAVSADGHWIVSTGGHFGERIYRGRLDQPGTQPELVHEVGVGEIVGDPAIDDDGNIYFPLQQYAGELEILPASPGRTF